MSTTVSTAAYKQTAEAILKHLRQERDRQIVAQRFGLGLPKRHTLEHIGQTFGITRERVRQIEKAATERLRSSNTSEIKHIDGLISRHVAEHGNVAPLGDIAAKLGATGPNDASYVTFLAVLAPSIEVVEDNDHFEAGVALHPHITRQSIETAVKQMTTYLNEIKVPASIEKISDAIESTLEPLALENIAKISKQLSRLEGEWGMSSWPVVNPKSIRDKTYLVLNKHAKPLHFSDIAREIAELGARKRSVTTQAVHNELIKDPRFVLVGRGNYALPDCGYTPCTVADNIADVLKEEAPLHKDEIIKRVLEKRQVKTTTIVLNLQEKPQFVRVAKATYALES